MTMRTNKRTYTINGNKVTEYTYTTTTGVEALALEENSTKRNGYRCSSIARKGYDSTRYKDIRRWTDCTVTVLYNYYA